MANEPHPIMAPASDWWKSGQRVTKKKGSNWTGRIVGFYSTDLTPEGYAVESETEKGSVQIYPRAALDLAPANAVLAMREEDGWQPVETCPADTVVDLFVRDADDEGAGYRIADCEFYNDEAGGQVKTDPFGEYWELMTNAQYATHWRPVPAPAPTADTPTGAD